METDIRSSEWMSLLGTRNYVGRALEDNGSFLSWEAICEYHPLYGENYSLLLKGHLKFAATMASVGVAAGLVGLLAGFVANN